MKILINCAKSLLILTSLFIFSGCAAVAIGGVGAVALTAHDRRSFGTVIDDQGLEFQSAQALRKISNTENAHINVTSYNHKVLLSGEVPDQQVGIAAENAVQALSGVEQVYNELIIAQAAPASSTSNDAIITAKVKTALVKVNVKGFDPTAVKVVTERGIVYLMGLLTEEEANAVIGVVQKVSGVQEIVKLFEYVSF